MKKLLFIAVLLTGIYAQAQIGVGTTTPNSTLDVRGSLSIAVTTFTTATTAGASDNMFLFTGTSATTLTLPTAVGITGRVYWIKNISSNGSTLTIATTSAQTIDGITTWTLTQTNKTIRLVSNGANWYIASESLPGSSTGTAWTLGGNNVASLQNIGTTSNYHLPFITNNTEKMRLTSAGSLGIGTTTFNATYPERLLVEAGTPATSGDYQNVIVGKGNTNSYAQLNIQNINAGISASSDVVATADNGSETTNYVDMGINSSVNTSGIMGVANDAYLYNLGQNFLIGTGTAAKSLVFMTGGTAQSTNERMRVDGNGNVGIGTTSPTAALHVVKSNSGGNVITIQNTSASGYSSADFYSNTGALSGTFGYGNASTGGIFAGRSYFNMYGNDFVFGNGSSSPLFIQASSNNVGIGTTTFNGTNPERLIVDAGTNGSGAYQNVIVGKGNTNSYAQLNIQNTYSAAGNSASSDVVATSNNGTELVNYIDMGINSGTNTTAGVIGGANTAYLYSTGNNFAIGNGTNSKDIVFFTTAAGTYTDRMHITSAGHLIPTANNAYNLGSASFRWATIYSQNALNTSDARLKTNIKDLNYGLSTVLNMRPVEYNWKEGEGSDDDKGKKLGFLAQELRKIIPEVVVGDESKETLAVNYIELIPVLVNAIKEQQKQIDDLKKKVKMLERK